MRTLLSESNFFKSAGLSVILTVMSIGRLVHTGNPLGMYIPMTFAAMMLVSGPVIGWGRHAGMPGIYSDRLTLLKGAAIAVALSLIALPVHLYWLDSFLQPALLSAEHGALEELSYPSTDSARISLVLWSAGFQVMFMQAAPMSIMGRLTGRRSAAVGLCLALCAYVVYRQITEAGIRDCIPLFMVSALVSTTAGCVVFARFGLVPTMLLAGGMDVHVFFTATRAAGTGL